MLGKVAMIKCPKCEIENTLDSKFCKGCATPIEEATVKAFSDEMDELAAEGLKAFNDHRTGEAKLIAETVLKPFPTHAAALSLLGMSLEREGRLAEALDVYEKLLDLNPNSALDRVKVQHLRQTITDKAVDIPEPRKGSSVLAGIAAAVLVISGGAVIAMAMKPGANTSSGSNVASNTLANGSNWNPTKLDAQNTNLVNPNQEKSDQPKTGMEVNTDSPQVKPNTADPNRVPPIQTPNPNENSTGTGTQAGNFRPSGRPNPMNGTLPDVNNGGGTEPVRITGPIGTAPNQAIPEQNQGSTSAQGTSTSSKPNEVDDPSPTVKRPNPGVVNIEVGGSSGKTPEKPEISGQQSPQQVANQHFLMKKYGEAAAAYEKVIAQGGGSPSVYQRLAQCYEHLGRKGDAANAYQRAIQLLEARGSKMTSREQSMLESCKQALKLVQG